MLHRLPAVMPMRLNPSARHSRAPARLAVAAPLAGGRFISTHRILSRQLGQHQPALCGSSEARSCLKAWRSPGQPCAIGRDLSIFARRTHGGTLYRVRWLWGFHHWQRSLKPMTAMAQLCPAQSTRQKAPGCNREHHRQRRDENCKQHEAHCIPPVGARRIGWTGSLGRCLNRPKRPHYCTWVERRCPKVYVYRGPWWPSCRATEMRRAAAERTPELCRHRIRELSCSRRL